MAAPEHHIDPFEHAGPWTEEDFLALPLDRHIELVDGSLVMSPSGSNRHQKLGFRLCAALDVVAPAPWEVLESANIRLLPGRILIPDVVVLENADMDATVNDVRRVRLAVEVVSPGDAAMDRALKPQLYAQSGIPWYLRVEQHPGAPVGHLHALDGEVYREIAVGTTVELTEPFPATLDLAHLAR